MAFFVLALVCCGLLAFADAADVSIVIDSRMDPPRWAVLERRLLADNVPAAREFYNKYFDDRGYLQAFVRWGANDGPDDAFENFNRWPELHALGARDDILQMYSKAHEGLLKQYTEARTTDVPIAQQGMYHKEFIVQSDWMHHGEGLQLFNRMGLSIPTDATYRDRARRFAGFYMGEDPEAPNYDRVHKIIRSMQNGSRGPMLRKATALDWVGDPFDVQRFKAEHGESTFEQFLAHYEEYTDVVGDHFLNLGATTLAANAYLLSGDQKYKTWLVEYMNAWLDRMRQNGGVIPSFVDLDGKIGGPDGKWWGNAYGWGFSPVNPVTGQREDRNRIGWAVVGFQNALLLTGDQRYVDAWRTMIEAVNAHARDVDGKKQYPTMHGAGGWYGWKDEPWNVGALDVWYWSQRPADLARTGGPWIEFLRGRNPAYPEQAMQRDLESIAARLNAMRRDATPAERRLADNMLDYNPVATESLVHLMLGALMPGRPGGLLDARLRYFDPERTRAGVPEDVAALVSELSDTSTTVTLVNLNASQPRTVVVQGGAYGEHQIVSVTSGGKTTAVNSRLLTVTLQPGCGEKLVLTMKRYANRPDALHPWHAAQQTAGSSPTLPYKQVEWPAPPTSAAGVPGAWNFIQVSSVAVTQRGTILVLHRGAHPIIEFDSSGKLIRSWGDGMFSEGKVAAIPEVHWTADKSHYSAVYGPAGCASCGAHSVRVDSRGNIWVIDAPGHVIYKMNAEGKEIMRLGTKGVSGTGRSAFNLPTDIAFAGNGDLYVTDGYGSARVVKFSPDGKYLLEWGKRGKGPGEFGLPHNLVIDAQGRVYVTDRDNQRIEVFDANGTFLREWTGTGGVSGLGMTKDQRIWTGGVLRDLDGKVIGTLPGNPGGHGVAVTDSGDVYIAQLSGVVQKFVSR